MIDVYTPELIGNLDRAISDARNRGGRPREVRVSRSAFGVLRDLCRNEQYAAVVGLGVQSPLLYRGVGVKVARGAWPDSYVAVTRFWAPFRVRGRGDR